VLGLAPVDPVPQVGSASSVVAGMTTAPSFNGRQDHLPQLDLVAQHEHDPVAPETPCERSQLATWLGPGGQFGERPPPLRTVLLDDHSAGRSALSGAAPRWSNHSSAQLNSSSTGQRTRVGRS